MDEALDDRLETEAARLGVSKASLIRDAVARRFTDTSDHDPISELIGHFDGEPVETSIDDVIYG